MQRSETIAAAARVRVDAGDTKVSCGDGVRFESVQLEKLVAIAVHDPVARVGGITVHPSAEPRDAALRSLVEAVLRMGGSRTRLRFTVAGDAGMLDLLLAEAPAPEPRRGPIALPPVLVLDLGSGRAHVE